LVIVGTVEHYDAEGNLISTSEPGTRLVIVGTVEHYDAEGNLISTSEPGTRLVIVGTVEHYDAEGNLIVESGPFAGSRAGASATVEFPRPDSGEGEPAPATLPFLGYRTAVQFMNLHMSEKPDPGAPVSDPTPFSSRIADLSAQFGESISISPGTSGIGDAYTMLPRISNIWDPTSEGPGWSGRTPQDLSIYYNRWIIVDPAENQ
jgi:hypothetical protein